MPFLCRIARLMHHKSRALVQFPFAATLRVFLVISGFIL